MIQPDPRTNKGEGVRLPLTAVQARLVEDNLDVAETIVRRHFWYKHSATLGGEDMISLAREFLCHAARDWKVGTGEFRAYAWSVIRFKMIDWLRVNGTMTRRGQVRPDGNAVPFILDYSGDSDSLYSDDRDVPSENNIAEWRLPQFERELVNTMWMEEALGELPLREEIVLRAIVLEDCSIREVAEAMGISDNRVWQLQRRALDRLRRNNEFIRAAS